MNAAVAVPVRVLAPPRPVKRSSTQPIVLRSATAAEAPAIHALIFENLHEGHLLPRELAEIVSHASRFVVAVQGDEVLACAELAPLSRVVAEVRSLVVSGHARSRGLGRTIVNELIRRAETAGFHKLCAFTHSPAYFVHMGFSIVPHVWLPEKIDTDCNTCVHFRQCGQYAVMLTLAHQQDECVPLAALHG
jgi:N-acetylglutamate synthase-like GNAT family acetyltransferase